MLKLANDRWLDDGGGREATADRSWSNDLNGSSCVDEWMEQRAPMSTALSRGRTRTTLSRERESVHHPRLWFWLWTQSLCISLLYTYTWMWNDLVKLCCWKQPKAHAAEGRYSFRDNCKKAKANMNGNTASSASKAHSTAAIKTISAFRCQCASAYRHKTHIANIIARQTWMASSFIQPCQDQYQFRLREKAGIVHCPRWFWMLHEKSQQFQNHHVPISNGTLHIEIFYEKHYTIIRL